MLTHSNLLHNYESANVLLKTTSEDVLLVPGLPLFHLLAQICVMAALYGGVPSVLMEFFIPSLVLENIARYKVNSFSGVPTMFALLLNDPEIDNYDLTSLRICFCSSAPLSLSLLNRFEERTGAIITEGYGLTEATALVTSHPMDRPRKPGSVGVPIRCEVRVVDEKDNDVPAGVVGEIVIRGKNVMKGYYNKPEATAETMRNGWLHTGDMGKYDADGYLYVVDRKHDLIITGGFNIYPAEIENVLYKHPAVAMATVIGIPDEIKGEIAKAYIVLKEGQSATEKEIIDFCRERIAVYKAPRAVEFRETLPTTPTGKILKRALRNEVLAAQKGGEK
jgi:long-chain acyl-CoA synthetase